MYIFLWLSNGMMFCLVFSCVDANINQCLQSETACRGTPGRRVGMASVPIEKRKSHLDQVADKIVSWAILSTTIVPLP